MQRCVLSFEPQFGNLERGCYWGLWRIFQKGRQWLAKLSFFDGFRHGFLQTHGTKDARMFGDEDRLNAEL